MFAFWHPGPTELIIILVVALLIFGKRLPEIARSLGKGIVEFKKGVRGIEEDIDTESVRPLAPPPLEKLSAENRPTSETGTRAEGQ